VAQTAEVVLFDLRGHGKSERPATGYTLSTFVADLRALLEALQLSGPIHLVGNSFGGLLALAFAAEQPERVASLVLLDGHLGVPGWGEAMARTLDLRGAERDQRIAESFKHWLGRGSERKSSKLAKTAEALVEKTTLIADIRGSPPLSPALMGRIACPVLALYGEQSDLRPQAQLLPSLLPRAKLIVRPGCSHSILWEATGWVREQLLAWLADLH
jgi:pimeloyl-ACP methyl ester carboxylesterase